jgi:acyl dehydratase
LSVPAAIISLDAYRGLLGRELECSRWFNIDQDRIDAFGHVTEDRQYIHVDPAAAARSQFGGAIAHGFLTLSLLSAMSWDAIPTIEGALMGINYGFNSIRFLAPVRSGSRVRGRFILLDLKLRGENRWQSTIGTVVEIEGEAKPALAAEWVTITTL